MAGGDQPTYELARIQGLVASGKVRITGTSQCDAGVLGFDESDIHECVADLLASDFHKTMPAEGLPGLFQDAYRPKFRGKWLYVKVQIVELSLPGELAVVISFKLK